MPLSLPVERALTDLRRTVTSLMHPNDREKALSMFAFLTERGERCHPDEIKRWALAHNFSELDAHDLHLMTDDVIYLRERLRSGRGWGRPEYWFEETQEENVLPPPTPLRPHDPRP
jgi:hypothetical protein